MYIARQQSQIQCECSDFNKHLFIHSHVIFVLVCSLAPSLSMDEAETTNPPPLLPRLKKDDKECYNSWPHYRKPAPLPRDKQDTLDTCTSSRKPMPAPRTRTQLIEYETVDPGDTALSDHCAVADDQDHKEPTLETMKIMMVSQLEPGDMEQNVSFWSEGEHYGTNGMLNE